MDLQKCKNKIDRYLARELGQALIVDVQNCSDLNSLVTWYNVGGNRIIRASDYCEEDALPQMDAMYHDIARLEGISIVTELSSFLKLLGELELRKAIGELLSMHIRGRVVIITYQCGKYLEYKDPRILTRVLIADGEDAQTPEVVFVSLSLTRLPVTISAEGLRQFASAMERSSDSRLYVHTKSSRDRFPNALYKIDEFASAYDVLSKKDPKTLELSESLGTGAQWEYALELFEKNCCWTDIIDDEFGSHAALEIHAGSLSEMSEERVWLYYIGLKLFGAKNNWCLNDSVSSSSNISDLLFRAYRGILNKDVHDEDFWECYDSRKLLLKQMGNIRQMGNPSVELTNFCRLVVRGKERDAIYFLTDNSQQEQEEIFKFLDQHGLDFEKEKLMEILQKVYPELYSYMTPYRFKNDLLDSYFQEYKYQKIINKLLPDFEAIVLDEAVKRNYNSILEPRSSKIEKFHTKESVLYFMDAMGAEYLGYIAEECHRRGLQENVTVCRCELPSLTCNNKEFLDLWPEDKVVSIKDIDEIKHHGKYDYNYYSNSKLPLHLIKELEVIRETIEKIEYRLKKGEIQSAVMVADHGASRLAVLHDTENIWEMAEKGKHSGRCCPKNEIDLQPEYATDAGDFWALANYDRFKGARRANVEVHGGATLEEICVPIIEIKYGDLAVEAYLMPVDADAVDFSKPPEIEVSYRRKAAVKIFMTSEMMDVNVRVAGRRYDAVELGNQHYRVDMPDLKKPGQYQVDVYSGDNMVAEALPLVVWREGQREIDLL